MKKTSLVCLKIILGGMGFLGGILAPCTRAEVKLPAIISDHMVLQRDVPVPIWGWASPGEEVAVTFAGQTKTATTDATGRWSIKLDKLSAVGPQTLTAKGANTVTVNDVLVGEVWLASGQSNMQLPVNGAANASEERAAALFPQIRFFSVARHPAVAPETDCEGSWIVCRPDTVGGFSAAAYFFGREVHQKVGTPVGLINASWGGTPIEAWISLPRQEEKKEFDPVFAPWREKLSVPYDAAAAQAGYERQLATWKTNSAKRKADGQAPGNPPEAPVNPREHKNRPANLFNGMIAPIIPYALRGAIWYQGENNAQSDYPHLYAIQLPLLIDDWRQRWSQGDFPFAWVQLPNFEPKVSRHTAVSQWSEVREAMLHTLAVPNTGMAVTIDVGDPANIHPKNKQAVGHRLALWARARVYGENIPYSGPLPAGQAINGDQITLSFTHTDGGLVAREGDVRGFAIAGTDQKWFPAQARIAGEQVIVSSPEVKAPVAVRYGWADNPDCALGNGAGLPASPFRTDHW